MKLLLQSDDYGISPAVALGTIHGIRNGLIRNTGLFSNMPWAAQCVEWIRPLLPDIAFGLDLNLTTGTPLSPPRSIPSLVRKDGNFHSSWESRKMDAEQGTDHADPQEILREFKAQLQAFVSLVGKQPDYIHPHAYTTPMILNVQREICRQYHIPFSSDVWQQSAGFGVPEYRIPWYKRPATLENQAASSLRQYILDHGNDLLTQDVCILVGHMGYLDRELMELSSYTLYRPNDLAGVTDPEVLTWVRNDSVQLITYRDL